MCPTFNRRRSVSPPGELEAGPSIVSTSSANQQQPSRAHSTDLSAVSAQWSTLTYGNWFNHQPTKLQRPPATPQAGSSASPSSVGSVSSSSAAAAAALFSSSSSPPRASPSDGYQPPAGVPRGLINLGNTCYMNASLQALYSIECFRSLLLARAPHDKFLTSELSDLFKSMKNSSAAISPSDFKYAFSRYQAKFAGLGQQDAQEFLRYLINGIHEELNQASRRRPSSGQSGHRQAPRTADEAWRQYRDIVDDSPLVDLVVGQLCSTIVCSQCQTKSHCWDPFWDLSLALGRGASSSSSSSSRYGASRLAQLVEEFLAKETLDSDERPVCSQCKRPTRSTKQISLSRLPQVLILHLKKFTNDGYKLTSPDIEIERTLTFNRTTYGLKACISHHGHSSSSGHYTSHCEYANRWFHFNDDRVRDVTSSFDCSKLDDAYVLFYTQSAAATSQQSKL